MLNESFDLERFVDAQDGGGTYEAAVRELRAGRKRSHWMWFVFPQLAGLGYSSTARHFALPGLPEAQSYLAHAVLGPRLIECAALLADLPTSDPVAIFGSVDALKLRSSMTLFAQADPDEPVFARVLEKFFAGVPDERTNELL